MKILIIGPAYPLRGGIANFSHALGMALQQGGTETGVVSFSYQYPSILFPGKTQQDPAATPPPLQIFPMIHSMNPFSWRKAAGFIRRQQPDAVVVQFWTPYLAPVLTGVIKRLGLRRDIPVIGLTHNIVPHEGGRMDNLLTRRFLARCDAFITLSDTVKGELESLYPGRPVRFIPHPVYDIFGEPVSREEGVKALNLDPAFTYLLFFGIIRPYKGLDLLLEALPAIREKHPDIRLIIAGEFYDKKEKYLALIQRHRLSETIILHDRFIPGDEVRYYFAAADLVVQPYRTASQSGITQMAYHFEKPMVVTNVGGLPELVADGRTGWVCDPDPRGVASAVIKFMDDKGKETMIKAIHEEKKRFSWEAMVEGIYGLVSDLRNAPQNLN